MNEKDRLKAWNIFYSSGQISDYLRYKQDSEKTKFKSESDLNADKNHGTGYTTTQYRRK